MSAAELTGYCPLCDNEPAEILNVGREHYAICHKCRAYWHVGSNLFSGWRNQEPADWECNKKLLAIYKNANTADSERQTQYMGYLESLPRNEVANAPTLNEYFGGKSKRTAPTKPKTPRPPLGLVELGNALLALAAIQEEKLTSEQAGAGIGLDLINELMAVRGKPQAEAFRAIRDKLHALSKLKHFDGAAGGFAGAVVNVLQIGVANIPKFEGDEQ